MRKKAKKNKNHNVNQKSFYFEDYLETNKKNKFNQSKKLSQDRIYLLFFLFFSLVLIFSIKIIHISLNKIEIYNQELNTQNYVTLRRDIVDRNGDLISRNIKSYHAAVNPRLVDNKENFLIKLRLNFPELSIQTIEKKLNKGKYFYIKKRINQKEKEKLWRLGEKGIIFEPFQSRIYTHSHLFSHVVGQVDYDNYGISGIEKYFDKELKNRNLADEPLKLTLDTNIQYLISQELDHSLKTFRASGGAALLLNVNNGEILSLVSLPNFDINARADLWDKNYINKITKGVYELGSIFKTFTIALALENDIVKPSTIIENIPRSVKCSKYVISDIKEFPKIYCRRHFDKSSNVGTLLLARKLVKKNLKNLSMTHVY